MNSWRSGAMCNRKVVSSLALALAIGCAAGQPVAAPAPLAAATPLPVHDEWDGEILGPGQGCTTVYATDGQQMLGGTRWIPSGGLSAAPLGDLLAIRASAR